MLRLLGIVFLVVLCIGTAPWGLLVGAIICVGWLLGRPVTSSSFRRGNSDEQLRGTDTGNQLLSAIPLLNAVYCVNCDLITNSPHDSCGVCGSHSVIGVSRMWQLTFAEAPTKAARYKISFTAEIGEIPATGLNESTKLISRLVELGGDVKALHIQVDPVFSNDANLELIKPMGQVVEWEEGRRRAS